MFCVDKLNYACVADGGGSNFGKILGKGTNVCKRGIFERRMKRCNNKSQIKIEG